MSLVDLDGRPMRAETVAFDVMDGSLAVIGQTYPDRDGAPKVTNQVSRTIKRTLSGMLLPAPDAAAIDPFRDRIRPRWVIEGDPTVYPLGVFLFADASALRRSYGDDLATELVDQTFVIDQPVGSSTSYSIGQRLDLAMTAVASAVGVPSFYVEPTLTALERPAVWPGSATWYAVLADLATMAGYLPPHFDNAGQLLLVSAPDPATATRSYPAGSPIIDPSIVHTDDLLTAPNRWEVVDNGATTGPIVGVYDLPASAPHSFFNRGFYITDYTEQQGLESVTAANLAARARALVDPSAVERASFDTVCDPRHDTFDVIDYDGRRWLEEAWSVTCRAGSRQTHEMRALYES